MASDTDEKLPREKKTLTIGNEPMYRTSSHTSLQIPSAAIKRKSSRRRMSRFIHDVDINQRRFSDISGESSIASFQSYTFHPGQKFLDADREKWPSEVDGFLALVASAVGLGNILSFPRVYINNGRAAFLVPYVFFNICIAWPVLYMDVLLGQFVQQGRLSVWKLIPLFKGLGYALTMISFMLYCFYSCSICWALVYIADSFNETLPWTTCNNPWNTPKCIVPTASNYRATKHLSGIESSGTQYFRGRVLRIYNSKFAPDDEEEWNQTDPTSASFTYGFHSKLGPPNTDLCLWNLLIFVVYFIILNQGISLSRRITFVTTIVPYIFLTMLLFRGVTLPGGAEALHSLIGPDWRALKKQKTWEAAALQVFYSTGAGLGELMNHASHNHFLNDVRRDAIRVLFVNALTSIFGTIMVLAYVGNVAHVQAVEPGKLLTTIKDSSILAFEIIPDAIGRIHGGSFFIIIFYLTVVAIGFDTAMQGMHSTSLSFSDEFDRWFPQSENRSSKRIFIFTLTTVTYVLSLLNFTRGGMFVYKFFENYAVGLSFIIVVLLQASLIPWVWGMEDLCNAAESMTGHRPGLILRFFWKILTPITIFIVVIFAAHNMQDLSWADFHGVNSTKLSSRINSAGLVFTFLPISIAITYAIVQLFTYRAKNFKERLKLLISPENVHERIRKTGTADNNRFSWSHLFNFGGFGFFKRSKPVKSEQCLRIVKNRKTGDKQAMMFDNVNRAATVAINVVEADAPRSSGGDKKSIPISDNPK